LTDRKLSASCHHQSSDTDNHRLFTDNINIEETPKHQTTNDRIDQLNRILANNTEFLRATSVKSARPVSARSMTARPLSAQFTTQPVLARSVYKHPTSARSMSVQFISTQSNRHAPTRPASVQPSTHLRHEEKTAHHPLFTSHCVWYSSEGLENMLVVGHMTPLSERHTTQPLAHRTIPSFRRHIRQTVSAAEQKSRVSRHINCGVSEYKDESQLGLKVLEWQGKNSVHDKMTSCDICAKYNFALWI